MWKRKLLSPISTALRRRSLPAPASHLPIHSSSQLGSSRLSSRREIRRPSGSERCYLLENLHLASRSYCSQPAEDSAARCWNCGSAAQSSPFLACNSCRSVQPVDSSVDYFQIFGLEKKYEIDGINLEGKYKDWQKKLHPDLVHTKSELKLEGVNVDEEETVSEPELLTEILEIREAVEEAADSQALNQIRSQMEEKLKHWSKSFANAIHCGKLEDALVCVRRMKYYTRVNEQITKKL
ncbi:iron-sulfur cluster co-chaperone protein HscB homolog isoform X2 [Punica granatum]|uniref:Iron-sulfur cluster co-chaperone protein HscB homolog isoform X2 n=1 Tax=Punica granatum TaxID=22663 RepID=A0A6P8DVB1_PUNGR|nr:iron-sulfur cluster co-chaperone protein HscB homolog isoform X2 [Punica granatum]